MPTGNGLNYRNCVMMYRMKLCPNLFGKRGIDQEHKAMLGAGTLTNPVNPGADTRGGLGITHQIEETDIIEKLNSLPSRNVKETRMSILKMMLESEKPWNLEGNCLACVGFTLKMMIFVHLMSFIFRHQTW